MSQLDDGFKVANAGAEKASIKAASKPDVKEPARPEKLASRGVM